MVTAVFILQCLTKVWSDFNGMTFLGAYQGGLGTALYQDKLSGFWSLMSAHFKDS